MAREKFPEAKEVTLEETLATIEEQKAVIAELNEQLEKANLQKAPALQVVAHGGKKYKVNVPKFRLGANICEAKDLEANPELVKELLALDGQSIITEI